LAFTQAPESKMRQEKRIEKDQKMKRRSVVVDSSRFPSEKSAPEWDYFN
jgi:hypothetical protein